MKQHFLIAMVAILLAMGCDKPKQGPLSAPIIEPPLLECAKTVTVKGFVPGAMIDIYSDGTRIGGGNSDAPWGQSFNVSPELVTGKSITATQTFGGLVSAPSAPIKVVSARKFYGGPPPKPVLNEPIYECGGAIGVSECAPGAVLRVYSDGVEIGRVDGCGAGQWLHVSPEFVLGRTITADVELCGLKSPLSSGVVVQAKPSTLPQLEVGEIYENGKYVNVYNITNGARVKTSANGTVFDDQAYSGGGQVVRVPPSIAVGDQLTALQELCGVISDPSDPSTVQPCSALPAPVIGQVCPGDTRVKIVSSALGARVQVYRNGTIIADGGGDEINLLSPAKGGETFTAQQSLGSCTSQMSLPFAVSCSKPVVNSVNIPYAGRAVSIAVDPNDDNRILVASETGGMFRSTNKGVHWQHISGANHFLFSDVTILPWQPNVVIATAEQDTRVISGGGIWRSVNFGSTWKQVNLTPSSAACVNNMHGFAVCVQKDTKRIWAGTTCGLCYSDDSGATWVFQPSVTGYVPKPVYAVETPTDKKIVIVVDSGLTVSTDQGASFTLAARPVTRPNWAGGAHNQIACGVGDDQHLFYTYYHPVPAKNKVGRSVFFSSDFGSTWSGLFQDTPDRGNRPLYVRTAGSIKGDDGKYMVYFGDGSCAFKRRMMNTGAGGADGDWADMAFDHCDPSDVAFANDGKTPLILTTDGGIHQTSDNGKNWKLAGGGPAGYNALQVAEVAAQIQAEGRSADLYFATQDNAIWASSDMGTTWPGVVYWEGYAIDLPRIAVAEDQNRVSGVTCGACWNYFSKRLLASAGAFPNPPKNNGAPKLLSPGNYLQNALPFDSVGFIGMLTNDTGSSWDSVFKVLQKAVDQPYMSGAAASPTLYIPYYKPTGIPATGWNQIGLKRVTGILSGAGPIVSEVNGISSLGIFQGGFGVYAPIGVDPTDPQFLIVPDIQAGFMRISTDGGGSWRNDTMLTRLVTNDRKLEFLVPGFYSQVTSIAFDPDCPQHILVGTVQAGIMTSYDRGKTWGKIPGTELIPYVSRFAFAAGKKMVVSSYGRGLWFFENECYQVPAKKKEIKAPSSSFVYHGGIKFKLSDIKDASALGDVNYFVVRGGSINGYILNRNQLIEQVFVSGGEIEGYDLDMKRVELPFKVVEGKEMGSVGDDKDLVELIRNSEQIKGLVFSNGRFKAPVLGRNDIDLKELPKRQAPEPFLIITEMNRSQKGRNSLDVKVRGKNFEPKARIAVSVNGQLVEPRDLSYDENGGFSFLLDPFFAVGLYRIEVVQKTSAGEVKVVGVYHKTTFDNR